jgi:hypothetical protein
MSRPSRTSSLAVSAAATEARIVPFARPSLDLLQRVSGDLGALRIPSFEEARRAYNGQYRADQQLAVDLQNEIKQLYQAWFPAHGIPWQTWETWRVANIKPRTLECYSIWENSAYLLGLYVARREYPRLRMGGAR